MLMEANVQYLYSKMKCWCIDVVPRIVVVGPPAAGKGSISQMICKSLGTEHVTMDSIMTEGDSQLAAAAEECIRSDMPIPSKVFARLIKSRSVFRLHQMHDIQTIAVDDPAPLSVCHVTACGFIVQTWLN